MGKPVALWIAMIAVTLTAVAGCHCGRTACGPAPTAPQHLFGPVAMALGQEDRGYFATPAARDDQASLFGQSAVFVRDRTWDVYDTRNPNRTYQRRRTLTESVHVDYR